MNKSLLFLPDISGFTEFVQTTEIGHSQHVISELLEVLIQANCLDLELAEVEGDALFLYKEEIPSLEQLLAQVETMFTAFYSHLKLLEQNRICPCKACSTAPNLQLKIIAHSGELQFITVQDKRKPFGIEVIEVHRLMKNTVQSDNYVLFSKDLTNNIELTDNYQSKLFDFKKGENVYDGKNISFLFSLISKTKLKIKPFAQLKSITFDFPPQISFEKKIPVSATQLFEYITNYRYRSEWVEGVDKFEFNSNEVTRLGTEHVCVINTKQLDFITITKEVEPSQLVYGELTTSPKIVDELYQFFILTPISNNSCNLKQEIFWKAKSPIKKILVKLFAKKALRKNSQIALEKLTQFAKKKKA